MKVMLDTNVLISMILFPNRHFNQLLKILADGHTLQLSSFVLDELRFVTARKFPQKAAAVEQFLSHLNYERIQTPDEPEPGAFTIRDQNDYPVLYSALIGDTDVFVTGDKDFAETGLAKPLILTPTEFIERFQN